LRKRQIAAQVTILALRLKSFRQYSPMVQLPNVLTPTPEQLFNLVGGIYTFSLGQSVMNLSTAREGDLVPSTVDWGPAN